MTDSLMRPPVRSSSCLCLCVSVCVCVWLQVSPALAQLSEEELRRERVETTEDLQRTEKISAAALSARNKRGWLLDYGFNTSMSYTASGNNDRNAKTQDDPDHTLDNDLQFFIVTENVSRNLKFYFRNKTSWNNNSKISAAMHESDVDQFKVDMFYAEREFDGTSLKHTLTVGRQFSKIGRGIAFGLTADGIFWKSKGKKMTATGFWMRQNPGDNNLDVLAPNSGSTKRWFAGAEYKHKFKKWMGLDVFTLWNFDKNNEQRSAVAGIAGSVQRYKFESQYYGLGTDGMLFSKLNYWWEYNMVRGKTYNASTVAKPVASEVNVRGSALDLGLRYLFGGDISPTVFTEYALGSGDADRVSNVTSDQRGSTFGDDSVYRSFGGLSMGNALSPSLANIRIFKLGGSAKPFGRWDSARWSDMTFNLTAYTYWTYAKGGATSDPVITTGGDAKSTKIGNEYDLTVSWNLFNDVKYQLKYGLFTPGSAYPAASRSHENYFKMKVAFDL